MEVIKPYKTYKDSGIAWLGKIPEHWEVRKLKNISQIETGTTPSKNDNENYSTDGIPWIKPDNLKGFKKLYDSKEKISQKGIQFSRIIPQGSILVCCIGTLGKMGIAGCDLTTNQQINSVTFKYNLILNEFGKYLIFASEKEYWRNATKSVVTMLNKSVQGNIKYCFPILIPEQTAIANFLDYKTAKIDRFIFKKKQLIKLLNEQKAAIINDAVTKGLNPKAKMKSSGIEWLGEIPEHWEVRKLKGICKAYGRIGFRGYKTTDLVNQGEGAITISPSNMKYDYMTFEKCTFLSWSKYEESPEIKIYNDDLIMVKTGSTFGKVGIVKDLEQKATINPQLLVLKSVKVNPNYLYLLLKSNLIQSQVKTEVIGSTIPTISQTKILNFKLIIPPDEEIEHLLKGIEKETAIITKTIATIEKEIALVQEYRTALIAEAVTGKIDVREYNVPSFEEDKEYAEMEEEMGLVAEDGEEMGIEN